MENWFYIAPWIRWCPAFGFWVTLYKCWDYDYDYAMTSSVESSYVTNQSLGQYSLYPTNHSLRHYFYPIRALNITFYPTNQNAGNNGYPRSSLAWDARAVQSHKSNNSFERRLMPSLALIIAPSKLFVTAGRASRSIQGPGAKWMTTIESVISLFAKCLKVVYSHLLLAHKCDAKSTYTYTCPDE